MDLRHKLFRIVRHSLINQRDLSGKSIDFQTMFLQVNRKPPIVVGGFFVSSAKTDNRADSCRNSCNFSNL